MKSKESSQFNERPLPKAYSEIDFSALRNRIIELAEETLDDLEEGYNPDTFDEFGNKNEDILEDNNDRVYEAIIEAIYGPEYWDYYNKRV